MSSVTNRVSRDFWVGSTSTTSRGNSATWRSGGSHQEGLTAPFWKILTHIYRSGTSTGKVATSWSSRRQSNEKIRAVGPEAGATQPERFILVFLVLSLK